MEKYFSEDESLLEEAPRKTTHSWRSRQWCRQSHFVASLTINCILLTVLVYSTIWSRKFDPSQGFYSPAQDAIEYYNTNFTRAFGGHVTPYQGWPDDALDQRWQDLYSKGSLLHLTVEEGIRLPNKTEHIPIPGYEHEYTVGLDVYHQLHCLNMVRQSIYPGRYNTTLTDSMGRVNYTRWMHLDHCVDSIRQYIMCHADISTLYFGWFPNANQLLPMLEGVHTCRNFSKIHEWALSRALEMPDLNRHVVDGKTVTFEPSKKYQPDAEDPYAHAPEGWRYTIDDL